MEIEAPSLDVKDKVAVATGSSKEVGFSIACGLAAYGAKVVILSHNMTRGEVV